MLLAKKGLRNIVDDSLDKPEDTVHDVSDDQTADTMRNANVDGVNTLNMSLPLVDWNKGISTEDDEVNQSLSEELLNVSIESPERKQTKSRIMKGICYIVFS